MIINSLLIIFISLTLIFTILGIVSKINSYNENNKDRNEEFIKDILKKNLKDFFYVEADKRYYFRFKTDNDVYIFLMNNLNNFSSFDINNSNDSLVSNINNFISIRIYGSEIIIRSSICDTFKIKGFSRIKFAKRISKEVLYKIDNMDEYITALNDLMPNIRIDCRETARKISELNLTFN